MRGVLTILAILISEFCHILANDCLSFYLQHKFTAKIKLVVFTTTTLDMRNGVPLMISTLYLVSQSMVKLEIFVPLEFQMILPIAFVSLYWVASLGQVSRYIYMYRLSSNISLSHFFA